MDRILDKVNNLDEAKEHRRGKLYSCEVNYLHRFEWTKIADYILYRRSKLGLILSKIEYQILQKWLNNRA